MVRRLLKDGTFVLESGCALPCMAVRRFCIKVRSGFERILRGREAPTSLKRTPPIRKMIWRDFLRQSSA